MEKYFSCLFFFFLNLLLSLLPPSSLSLTCSSTLHPPPPECREDERSALLEFKEGFRYPIDSYYTIYLDRVKFEPWKLHSWKLEGGNGNCCTWEGVECDAESGHVIGLNLSCTGLRASINSSSSLFRLVHLQKLNLAFTYFNASPIPSAIGHLPRLMSLNLSHCGLKGQIPQQILDLTDLSSLDLSDNEELELVKPNLGDLAMRLTKLEELHLSFVQILSPLPHALTNSSSLSSLILEGCGLKGRLPPSVFSMPNLQVLDLSNNYFSGHLPEFHLGGQLKSLILVGNNLSGVLPTSTNNLTGLIELALSINGFLGPIPSFANMTQLQRLFLHDNMFSGIVHLDKLLELKHLEELDLAFNDLSVVSKSNTTTSRSSKLTFLRLALCNLRELPKLLLGLQQLSYLDLSSNIIHGQVPTWFQYVSRQNLRSLDLSDNLLTGFEGNSVYLKWEELASLDISFNNMEGQLPFPPKSIRFYRALYNRFSGELPPLLCSWRFIQLLDLAMNNFSGAVPRCFSNLTDTLVVLSLRDNNLHGEIPYVPGKYCPMMFLDLSNNQLGGQLPRTLSRCTDLEFLNVGDNMIEDTFPSWFGTNVDLRVLILRSNRFHGAIEEPKNSSEFQSLQIIDLSWNNFENHLPAKFFQYWTSMEESDMWGGGYMGYAEDYTLTINNKGMEMAYGPYGSILSYLQAIDFSGNNFSGEIPESIANLEGLRLLNLSSNNLSGPIPPILGGLTDLESLDLSRNRLSGEIPQQLTHLGFLEFFNVSNNQLSGPVPQGMQFDTFKNTSYEGNEGLCGVPLSRTCGSPTASPPASSPDQKEKDSDDTLQIEWKAVLVGYVAGFVIAAVIGHKIMTSRPDWFSRAFGFVETRRRM